MQISSLPTSIFIDGSNIRLACSRCMGLDLDFRKLHDYFADKYPNLGKVYYFEGMAIGDKRKTQIFAKYKKWGYEIRSFDRKSYSSPAVFKHFKCRKCGTPNRVKVLDKIEKMKSNVDVYLCAQMMSDASQYTDPAHLILISCDGDYAEMVRILIENNKNLHITIMATPYTKDNNFLSSRLQKLRSLPRVSLFTLDQIKDKIGAIK